MSRKILKIGTDVLTLNDKLVSVTEDYPFWKVNLDLDNDFYSKLIKDVLPVNYDFEVYNSAIVGDGTNRGGVLGSNGIDIYTIPSNNTKIIKFNTVTKISTEVANIAGLDKFIDAKLVGDLIIYIPSSATYIGVLDTITGVFTTVGSFSGSTKWGKSCFLPNGNILAPPKSASQNLIINATDSSNITTSLVSTGYIDTAQHCSVYAGVFADIPYAFTSRNSGTGRIYSVRLDNYNASVNSGLITIQTESIWKFGTNIISFQNNGNVLISTFPTNPTTVTATCPSTISINSTGLMANNQFILLNSSATTTNKYYTFNPINNVYTEVKDGSPLIERSSGVITNKFGETYSIPFDENARFMKVSSPITPTELNVNRVLYRQNNRT